MSIIFPFQFAPGCSSRLSRRASDASDVVDYASSLPRFLSLLSFPPFSLWTNSDCIPSYFPILGTCCLSHDVQSMTININSFGGFEI